MLQTAHRSEVRTLVRAQQWKQLTQFLVLLVPAVAEITFALHPTGACILHIAAFDHSTADGPRRVPLKLPQMLVGPRPRYAANGIPVYRSCGYDDLLTSIK